MSRSSVTAHALRTAGLLFLVSCAVTNILTCSSTYKFIPSLLYVIICTTPLTLPLSYLMWSVPLVSFRAKAWLDREAYMSLIYDPTLAHPAQLVHRFNQVGIFLDQELTLPAGHYQIETESRAETVYEIRPGLAVPWFTGQGNQSTPLTLESSFQGILRVKTPTPDTRWKLSLRTAPRADDEDRAWSSQSLLYYSLSGSGDRLADPIRLLPGEYQIHWSTPFSHVQILLMDASGQHPRQTIVNRTRPTYYTQRWTTDWVDFFIEQEGDYRFRITVWARSRDDRWVIQCRSHPEPEE